MKMGGIGWNRMESDGIGCSWMIIFFYFLNKINDLEKIPVNYGLGIG
jgi:hypothetical protein